MKKLFSLACAAALVAAMFSFAACGGPAEVNYTLSEDGTHYIVSGVSGNASALQVYEVPSAYSAEEGGRLLPVTEIGEKAFMGCTSLTRITIPDTIEKIGARAFSYCNFRTFTIPEGVKSIGLAAFNRCSSLTEITIPASVTELEPYAFDSCSNLETVVIKANIEDLPLYAFANSYTSVSGNLYTSTSLTNVYLPASLKKINVYALDGNLFKDLYFGGSEQQWDELYFYTNEKAEGKEDGFEEKRHEKSAVLGEVQVHFNAEF